MKSEKVTKKSDALFYNKKVYEGEFGDNYDANSIDSKDFYRQRIFKKKVNEIIKDISNKNLHLLDIACGTGLLSLDYYSDSKNSKIYNNDISRNMLNRLKNKLSSKDPERSKFICSGALEFLKKTDVEFDLIGMASALHHYYDYLDILDISLRKIRKGGYLYIALDPQLTNDYKNYLLKIFKTLDNAFLSYKTDKISPSKFVLYLLSSPFNFVSTIVNRNKGLVRLRRKILNEPLENPAGEDYLLSEVRDEGLYLKKIIGIIKKNGFKITYLNGAPNYNFEFTYKLLNFLGLNNHFQLIAKK